MNHPGWLSASLGVEAVGPGVRERRLLPQRHPRRARGVAARGGVAGGMPRRAAGEDLAEHRFENAR